jgi:hypothetical protein
MARFVCEAEAAKQLGIPRSTFLHWVETGILPKPIPDLGLYDMKALDKACDRISGLGSAEKCARCMAATEEKRGWRALD